MNWYYVDQGQQAGPVDDAQLEQLRASGRIQPGTLVWREGMANWIPYSEALGTSAPPPPGPGPVSAAAPVIEGPQAVCTECGRMFPTENMIRYGTAHVCATCKPVFMQKLAEGAKVNTTGTLIYAGFWIRFVAKVVDSIVLTVILVVPMVILMIVMMGFFAPRGNVSLPVPRDNVLAAASDGVPELVGNIIGLFAQFVAAGLNILYSGFFIGKYGATPGKMLCKLHVTDPSGGKIGYGRAFGRAFAEILSGMICWIGYIIVAFDSEKRSLHDHICNTRVVYK